MVCADPILNHPSLQVSTESLNMMAAAMICAVTVTDLVQGLE